MGRASRQKLRAPMAPLKLDFGCGPHKREGFNGVDAIAFPGVDFVVDLTKTPWPWDNNSVAEAHASHFIEHLTALQRVAFCNEIDRILVPGGKCSIVVPHWASCRAYGDPTHQWPPVSEFWFYYLSREWRTANAPHTDAEHLKGGFSCDLHVGWGYSLRDDVLVRAQEYQQFAIQNYKEVCLDTLATLTKPDKAVSA